jgi:hypothetical protein
MRENAGLFNIRFDTIQKILSELKFIPRKDGNEVIKGKYVFEQVPDGIGATGYLPHSEVLTDNSTGINVFELAYVPLNKMTTNLYVNGIARKNYTLIGKIIILPFLPAIGSKIEINYFRLITESDPEPIVEKVNTLWAFMQIFIHTNNILTTDEGELLLTDSGEYIEVDIL